MNENLTSLYLAEKSLVLTNMVILIIFFVAWLFSLTFLELMVNKFTKNLHERTQNHMKIHRKVIARVVHCMVATAVLTLVAVVVLSKER
jgi:hypothetical protein